MIKQEVVADIWVSGGSGRDFAWRVVFGSSLRMGGKCSSSSEAIWRAVDVIRQSSEAGDPIDGIREDKRASGVVRIHSTCGTLAALSPIWAVPQYHFLEWQRTERADLETLATHIEIEALGSVETSARDGAS